MAYQKINFLDQDVERPRTYEMQENSDGTVTLVDSFGVITEIGTPINRENMNHIEDGIVDCDNRIITNINNINTVKSDVTILQNDMVKALKMQAPNYNSPVTRNFNTTYTAENDGFIYFTQGNSGNNRLYINGIEIGHFICNAGTFAWGVIFPIAKGDTYRITGSGGIRFYNAKRGA